MQVTTIGLDLAKNVFQVHGITDAGTVAFNRSLRRARMHAFFARLEPCLVGMEACSTSHYWARELKRLGHKVRLIPPSYVKPYVKRGKSDSADAEAICEAVTRPTMRFVEVKSPEQQAILSLHRARDLVVRQRTQIINMLRGLLAEFGIVFPKGVGHAIRFARHGVGGSDTALPAGAQAVIDDLCRELLSQHARVDWYGRQMAALAKRDPNIALLQTIPGIGPITASAIAATIGTARQFRSGRDLSAWLGLTPLNRSSGGKERLGRVSKMGDRYIRRLLVVGMTSRIKQIKHRPEAFDPWFSDILDRKPAKLAAVAMANKTARIVWAVLSRGTPYQLRTAASEKENRKAGEPKSKTDDVMADGSDRKLRHPVLCPEQSLFDMQDGTRFAETIRASGHRNRVNRPLSLIALQSTARQREHKTASETASITSDMSCLAGDIHTAQSMSNRADQVAGSGSR